MNAIAAVRSVLCLLAGVMLVPVAAGTAAAQQEAAATLTLEEAIALARRHNPAFQMQRNDEAEADWAVREAYASALLPNVNSSMNLGYQGEGTPRFGIFTGADLGLARTPPYYSSSYGLTLGYRLNGATLFRLSEQRSARRAVVSRTEAAAFQLEAEVTRRYLAVLRAEDGVELARQELERAEENFKLASARVEVGAAIALESKQAELERGRAEVALLQAERLFETEKLRLIEQLGIELERDVVLITRPEVFNPTWDRDELVRQALGAHPEIRALRAGEDQSRAALRSARSQYLPTVDVSAGWSGYTREAGDSDYLIGQARSRVEGQMANCHAANEIFSRLTPPLPAVDCEERYRFTADDEARIRSQNRAFPFEFSREPLFAQVRISLPIFQGFGRQRQAEAARALHDDARHRLRAQELATRADVSTAFLALRGAEETVALERRNRELAEEQLQLARERYRLGATNFLELSDAETIMARAGRAHLGAVYGFHESLAALEAAVGARLRPAPGGAPEEDR